MLTVARVTASAHAQDAVVLVQGVAAIPALGHAQVMPALQDAQVCALDHAMVVGVVVPDVLTNVLVAVGAILVVQVHVEVVAILIVLPHVQIPAMLITVEVLVQPHVLITA